MEAGRKTYARAGTVASRGNRTALESVQEVPDRRKTSKAKCRFQTIRTKASQSADGDTMDKERKPIDLEDMVDKVME